MANKKLKADNARLKAEVERLTALKDACKRMIKRRDKWIYEHRSIRKQLVAEVDRLTAFTTRTIIPNEELKAQVERLTKAGDELWEFAKLADTNAPKARRKALKDWNNAKEGKQP